MSALVKKEIRLLLPAWIVAMALAVLPFAISIAWSITSFQNNPADRVLVNYMNSPMLFFAPFIFIFVGVLFLGINSFGQEMNSGTFTTLLAQPTERHRVWLVKISTLALAYVLVWLTAVILVCWQFNILERAGLSDAESSKSFALEFLTLSALVTFSGGLWTSLLLRQTTGAFWFSLLTPLAIVLGISSALDNWIAADHSINAIVVVALILYSTAGFFWAWRLFMRAQDLQWAGGEISLPSRERISQPKTASIPSRPRHWLFTLAGKEIQLHQTNLVIAAFLLFLNLSCVVVLKIHPHPKNPDTQYLLETIWGLWLLMPLLIGATAIAGERRLNIMESQLCLPVSRLTQWFVKFCFALILSLLLGSVMPRLIEGSLIVDNWIFTVAAGIFFISFYASSLGRTTLQAIGLAVVVGLVMFFYESLESGRYAVPMPYYSWDGIQLFQEERHWILFFQCFLTAPVLLLSLSGLAFWNFKYVRESREIWLMNIFILLAALVFLSLLTPAIFEVPFRLLHGGHEYFQGNGGILHENAP